MRLVPLARVLYKPAVGEATVATYQGFTGANSYLGESKPGHGLSQPKEKNPSSHFPRLRMRSGREGTQWGSGTAEALSPDRCVQMCPRPKAAARAWRSHSAPSPRTQLGTKTETNRSEITKTKFQILFPHM